MTRRKARVKVTFDETAFELLSDLANKTNMSVAGLVRELTIETLEDQYLSGLAER